VMRAGASSRQMHNFRILKIMNSVRAGRTMSHCCDFFDINISY